MALKWDCLEAVAGVSAGAAACFVASNPLAVAAVVPAMAGAKLFALFGTAREKHGLESEKELARIRAAMLAAWADTDPHAQFDVESADAALGRLLEAAMPDAMTLGNLVATPDYPGGVVTLVLDQLARRDDRFGRDGIEHKFASVVIRAALETSLANPDYTKALTVPMLIGLGQGVADANAKLDALPVQMQAIIDAAVAKINAGSATDAEGLLRRNAAELLQLNPSATREEVETSLQSALKERDALKAELDALRAEDNRIAGLINAAELAIDEGRLAEARNYLDEVIALDLEKERESRARRARSLAAKARTFLLALDYPEALRLLDESAAAEPDAAEARDRQWQAAYTANEWGERSPGPAPLNNAIRRWQALVTAFATDGDEINRAGALNGLGNALATLGKRQDDGGALADAVTAFRAALTVRTRKSLPLGWAMTQNNLGTVLQTLGARQDNGAALADAVTAYRAALTIYTREALPLDWAMTQNNLGNVLQTLGARQDDGAALADAVTAYRAALSVRTREALPLEWAMTQNNLGNALTTSGEREDDGAALADAVTAYRAALTVHTREALPLGWAATENNLGTALATLGERQDDGAALADAVTAYRAALTVRTREALPLEWAATQNNLGIALRVLGKRQDDGAALADAVTAYRAALTVRTREALPLDWAMTQENIAYALRDLARLQRDAVAAGEAVSALRDALAVFAHPSLAYNRAKAERGLAQAEALLAELRGG